MIFGKYINRYYIKYVGWLILGLFALVIVDWFQLIIPNMYQMVINGMNTGFVESVICVILGYGGYLVYQGQFNAGQLVEFIGYFTAIVWPIMAVAELIDMVSRGNASLKRISELLDAKKNVVDREGVKDIKGDIEFRNLTFRYPDDTIFIDGQDVNTVAIRDVRAGCAYVPQDNFLFSDTIENNISFGVDDKEQRISIARALMKDAPILILDDSVSAVDTKTERTILKNLRDTRATKTTILIAHRISTIEQMDKVLFIEEGKVVAFGKHSELYNTCPAYQKMS